MSHPDEHPKWVSALRHWVLTKAISVTKQNHKNAKNLAGTHTSTCCSYKSLINMNPEQYLKVKCIMTGFPNTPRLSFVQKISKNIVPLIPLVEPMLVFWTRWDVLHLFTLWENVTLCTFARNKSSKTFLTLNYCFWLKLKSSIHSIAFSSEKVILFESEINMHRSSTVYK